MQLAKTQTIVLSNQKGGCGKTTASVSIAAALARAGYSVTLIDTDPQCNATDSFGLVRDDLTKQGRFTVADAYMAKKPISEIQIPLQDRFGGNLAVVASHRGLSAIQPRLDAEVQNRIASEQSSDLDADDLRNEHRARLKNALASLQGKRDFVVIDTPPDLGFILTTALIAADWYIIPVFPSGYDLKGLETLTRTVEKVQKRYNAKLRLLGVLLGNYDGRAKLDRDIQKMLVDMFGEERVFQTNVNRSVKHREATVYGLTIFEHAEGEQSSQQYEQVAREIISRIGGEPVIIPMPKTEGEPQAALSVEVANG